MNNLTGQHCIINNKNNNNQMENGNSSCWGLTNVISAAAPLAVDPSANWAAALMK